LSYGGPLRPSGVKTPEGAADFVAPEGTTHEHYELFRRPLRVRYSPNHGTKNSMSNHPSKTLADFAATLRFEEIPAPVLRRAEDLFLDWFGSALAGKGARPVETIGHFAITMGPSDGASEVLISRRRTSPLFAAMVNAASSHFAEQDDVHNGAVFHPGTVVFPPALAVAQATCSSGSDLLTAAVAGYEVGIRVGEFLGRSHYQVFHTTGTAGTLAAAAAVGRMLNLSAEQMLDAFGSAGTQSAGLWEFLRDAADSKQLHTAKAAADGLLSAYLAKDGFTGAKHILEGPQGMAAGMSSDADPARLTDRLGERWALVETSFKYHASCRHTHPAADALQFVIARHGLKPEAITRVTAHVHQAAIDVLGPVVNPQTVHHAKFSMGTVLGIIALYGRAGMKEFAEQFNNPHVAAFREKCVMALDPEVEAAYPKRWIGKVTVETANGRTLHGRVDEPKGDPGNTLTRSELEQKALRLAEFSGAATPEEMSRAFAQIWNLPCITKINSFLRLESSDAIAQPPVLSVRSR
jgi:2-methylcitrate dehydratase PrpD